MSIPILLTLAVVELILGAAWIWRKRRSFESQRNAWGDSEFRA
jgi:hypothetical protein